MAAPPTWSVPAPSYAAGRTEVAAYMASAGWSHADMAVGLAIAEAESSLDIASVSAVGLDGSRGYGVWQLRHPGMAGALTDGAVGNGDWISIHANAAAALAVRTSQGWTAWPTYRTGAYVLFLPGAQAAVQALDVIAASLGPAATAKHPGLDSPLAAAVVTPATVGQEEALTIRWREGLALSAPATAGPDAIAAIAGGAGTALLPAFKAAAPFASVTDFLNRLADPSTWVRIAQVGIGAALVVVALGSVSRTGKV